MESVWERIMTYNKGRMPDMMTKKLAAMQANIFGFYRGTCHLYSEDYKAHFKFKDNSRIWSCGDLHFENFGTYKAFDRKVYFDINDFDEGVLAPLSFDVIRLITSFYVVAIQVKMSEKKAALLANCIYNSYYKVIQKGKPINGSKSIRSTMIRKLISKVEKRREKELLKKRVKFSKTPKLRIIQDSSIEISNDLKNQLIGKINKWSVKKGHRFTCLDVAFRMAGTGSLGIKRYITLLQNKQTKKYLLVDVKEAMPSCVDRSLHQKQPKWKNEASRVVRVQNKTQYRPPHLLNTLHFDKSWYVIKELQPMQDKVDITQSNDKIKMLEQATDDMGEITASGQLRTCGYKGADSVKMIKKHVKKNIALRSAILDYAFSYSKQVNTDYKEFCASMEKNAAFLASKPEKKRINVKKGNIANK